MSDRMKKYDQLTRKEKQLIALEYPYKADRQLWDVTLGNSYDSAKFFNSPDEIMEIKEEMAKDDVSLINRSNYVSGSKTTTKSETISILDSLIAPFGEETYRNQLQMADMELDPSAAIKDLILIQKLRLQMGMQYEVDVGLGNNPETEACARGLESMIKTYNDIVNGQKHDVNLNHSVSSMISEMDLTDEDFIDLLGYRFSKSGSLYNHPVRNIMLAALIDLKGNLTEATKYMCQLLNIKGTVLPLTEEKVELVGQSHDKEYYGEEEVSNNIKDIRRLTYDHDIRIGSEIRQKVLEADLIIFSSGSLYTSILPHLISSEVLEAIDETKAPLMYIANLVTQPGETDDYNVSDHLRVLNQYLGNRKIDIVVANNASIDERIMEKYLTAEHKTIVSLDRVKIAEQKAQIIEGDIFCIENDKIRHNALKTAYYIFSYLMENE